MVLVSTCDVVARFCALDWKFTTFLKGPKVLFRGEVNHYKGLYDYINNIYIYILYTSTSEFCEVYLGKYREYHYHLGYITGFCWV